MRNSIDFPRVMRTHELEIPKEEELGLHETKQALRIFCFIMMSDGMSRLKLPVPRLFGWAGVFLNGFILCN